MEKFEKQFKAVIFDMDGVLVDTENYYLQRRSAFFAAQGVDDSHMTPGDYIGANLNNLWPKILRENYTPERAASLYDDYVAYKSQFPLPYEKLLFPDVKPLLDYLKSQQIPLALASSSSMKDIEKCLSIHQLRDYFSEIFSGNDFPESKPNPAIYQAAIKAMNIQPSEALIIEDSQNGIAAGKAAGATVWAISDAKFHMKQDLADQTFPNLAAIQAQLQEINN